MDEHYWWAVAALLVGGLVGFLLGHLRAVRAGAEAAAARSQAAELGRQIQSLDEERRTLAARSWRKRVAELDARVRQTRLHQQLDLHKAVRLKDAEPDSLV